MKNNNTKILKEDVKLGNLSRGLGDIANILEYLEKDLELISKKKYFQFFLHNENYKEKADEFRTIISGLNAFQVKYETKLRDYYKQLEPFYKFIEKVEDDNMNPETKKLRQDILDKTFGKK